MLSSTSLTCTLAGMLLLSPGDGGCGDGCRVPTLARVPARGPLPALVARADDKKEDAQKEEEEIHKNLAKLSPDDRKAAEAQKYCVIEDDNRLGSMGVPVKLMIKGQPVFLCCKGCTKEAQADPDKTLAKVKDLKAKAKAEEEKKK